jgi:hypothetical protein
MTLPYRLRYALAYDHRSCRAVLAVFVRAVLGFERRRAFEIDVLACPDGGGRLRLLATIEDPEVIAKILAHLDLPLAPPQPAPAQDPDWLPGFAADDMRTD